MKLVIYIDSKVAIRVASVVKALSEQMPDIVDKEVAEAMAEAVINGVPVTANEASEAIERLWQTRKSFTEVN